MTLKFSRLVEVVNHSTCATFHQAKCSASCVIVLTERKNSAENNTAVAWTGSKNR